MQMTVLRLIVRRRGRVVNEQAKGEGILLEREMSPCTVIASGVDPALLEV
jgi:hypothetical protein